MLVGHLDKILEKSEIGTAGYWHASRALDTYADERRFFSYRRTTHRQELDYGRLMSAIVLK